MQTEGEREEVRRELHVLARMLHSEDADVSSRASSRIKDMVQASNPAQVILECACDGETPGFCPPSTQCATHALCSARTRTSLLALTGL